MASRRRLLSALVFGNACAAFASATSRLCFVEAVCFDNPNGAPAFVVDNAETCVGRMQNANTTTDHGPFNVTEHYGSDWNKQWVGKGKPYFLEYSGESDFTYVGHELESRYAGTIVNVRAAELYQEHVAIANQSSPAYIDHDMMINYGATMHYVEICDPDEADIRIYEDGKLINPVGTSYQSGSSGPWEQWRDWIILADHHIPLMAWRTILIPNEVQCVARCRRARIAAQQNCTRQLWGWRLLFDPKEPNDCLFEAMARGAGKPLTGQAVRDQCATAWRHEAFRPLLKAVCKHDRASQEGILLSFKKANGEVGLRSYS